MVNLSLEHGVSEFTPLGYVRFAAVQIGFFHDYRSAYQFALMSLELNEKKVPDQAVCNALRSVASYSSSGDPWSFFC